MFNKNVEKCGHHRYHVTCVALNVTKFSNRPFFRNVAHHYDFAISCILKIK